MPPNEINWFVCYWMFSANVMPALVVLVKWKTNGLFGLLFSKPAYNKCKCNRDGECFHSHQQFHGVIQLQSIFFNSHYSTSELSTLNNTFFFLSIVSKWKSSSALWFCGNKKNSSSFRSLPLTWSHLLTSTHTKKIKSDNEIYVYSDVRR